MRIAHSLIPWGALVLAATTPWAQAQTPQPLPPTASSTQADWLSPAADTLPLQHPALPASGGVEQTNTPWADANAAIGAFPRGHADVLRWEAAERAGAAAPATTPGSPAVTPAQCPMGMEMHRAMHPQGGAMAMPHGMHHRAAPAAETGSTPAHTGTAQPVAPQASPEAPAPAHHHGGQH